ncbi:MAG: hypothetical protein WBH31_02870, partial [Promethearchaeia archaeon]
IFEWAKEVEKIYQDLIEKAKKENLREIQTLRDEQEKIFDESLKKNQNFVNLALISLNEDVNKENEIFRINLEKELKEIESKYEKNKVILIRAIIDKLGLNLDV